MPTFFTLRVTELIAERPGLQRVRLDDGSRAYSITQLTGTVAVGDEVVVNTTAVELGLGTGGWHVVHWNLARRELHQPGPGHIMKLRYTSLQVDTGAAEELTPTAAMRPDAGLPDLHGVPVLVGSLHSQVGVAAAVIATLRPGTRVSYVMTDGAALPLVLSDLVADLRDRDLLSGTVTAGHAFGGDAEAVSVASALQIAVEVQRAEIVICAMGPGVVGTDTTLGTTSIEVAAILSTAERLGASPVAMLRASSGDLRPRHQGISHHSRSALALVGTPLEIPVPPELLADAAALAPHVPVVVEPPDVAEALTRHGLTVTTMGRGPGQDGLFFRSAGAAAARSVDLLSSRDTVAPS